MILASEMSVSTMRSTGLPYAFPVPVFTCTVYVLRLPVVARIKGNPEPIPTDHSPNSYPMPTRNT